MQIIHTENNAMVIGGSFTIRYWFTLQEQCDDMQIIHSENNAMVIGGSFTIRCSVTFHLREVFVL